MSHRFHYTLVYDQNLVSVSATETKTKFRYRFRGQNFFCRNLNFPFFSITSDRNRLKPENAEKLLFLRENLPKIQFRYDLIDKEQPQDDTNI